MPGETLITVRGEAQVEAEPEIAVLGVQVEARDKDRERAVALLAARLADLTELTRESGDGAARIESRPVQVRPVFKDAKARTAPAAFAAHGGFTVTLADFTVLGELVAVLACEDLVTITGPEWQLRHDSPVYREVRLAAARDSIARARDYAEAFGGRIVGLAEAADTGLLSRPDGQWRSSGPAARRMSSRAEFPEGQEIDLMPARQIVSAQVEARFVMTQPALGT